MKQLVTTGLWCAAAAGTLMASGVSQQAGAQPTVAAVRQAAAAGQMDDAWALLERMPADTSTVALAVDLALTPKTPRVDPVRLPPLADRVARLSASADAIEHRLVACAVIARFRADAACEAVVVAITRGDQGTAVDRARLWVTRRLLGEQPVALPAGWEAGVTGSSALEVATWPELTPASRVRLIEPLLTSTDMGVLISALATLQTIPGQEALAVWQRLSAGGGPSYPGAKTQILIGLARHGDAASLQTVEPYLAQLSASDRLVLAQGRAERGEETGVRELVSFLSTGSEPEAVRAAETLAALPGTPSIEARVRTWVRTGSFTMRARWLAVAGRLNLGATPEVVERLTSDDESARLAATVAVASAAVRSGQPVR